RQLIGGGLGGGVLIAGLLIPEYTSPWGDARSFARAAETIRAQAPPGSPVWVFGEPPLQFYLHTSDYPSFNEATVAAMDSGQLSGLLVTGRYVKRVRVLAEAVRRHDAELTLI